LTGQERAEVSGGVVGGRGLGLVTPVGITSAVVGRVVVPGIWGVDGDDLVVRGWWRTVAVGRHWRRVGFRCPTGQDLISIIFINTR
jgi:hypothetical protein